MSRIGNSLLRLCIDIAILWLRVPERIIQGINARIVWTRAVLESERMKL